MPKVDPKAPLARYTRDPGGYQPNPAEVGRPPYRREPYVHATLPDGTAVDTKAAAWTSTHVLLTWDDDGTYRNVWVPAAAVRRIPRRESTWQDPYDDFRWYAADGQL